MFVDRTPCWASSAPSKGSCAAADANRFDVTRYGPSDVQDFVAVSTFLATRYGPKLAAYEIWNEPDHVNEKYWAGSSKIARYVAMTKAVYGPLKAINPQLQVLAGSFVGINGKWLQALYDAGIKGFYDGLAVHFYDLPLLGLTTTRAVQAKNGDTAPLWLTEFGWTSCAGKGAKPIANDHPCVTAANQAKAVGDVYGALSRIPWVASAIMYTLRDEAGNAYKFGILDRAGRKKPAYQAVKHAIGIGTKAKLRGVTLKLARSGSRVAATGTGSIADTYKLTVRQGGVLRYRAILRTGPSGTYRLVLPAWLGRSGLTVKIASQWTQRGVTRHR
jgi:hypothetical protein